MAAVTVAPAATAFAFVSASAFGGEATSKDTGGSEVESEVADDDSGDEKDPR